MSFRFALSVLPILFATACHSTPKPPCPDTQAIVVAVAKEHPEVSRLSVHTTPPGGKGPVAVASTAAEKLGTPSDVEDVNAMAKGTTVVLETAGEVDVTVPICMKDNKYTAAAGVTFKTKKGADKKQLEELATAIAKVVEQRMSELKK